MNGTKQNITLQNRTRKINLLTEESYKYDDKPTEQKMTR